MSDAPLLSAGALTKNYGKGFAAVRNVSLQLNEGDSLAVIGPSGAGKSTLLQLLAGFLSPDEGKVYLQGQPLEDPDEQLIRGNKLIRMVHQDFGLAANRTVHGNLDMLLRKYDAAYRQEETNRMLEAVRLTALSDHPVSSLSGGEKQRLGLARALVDESKVVLLDEPFSQQDTLLKAHLYEVIFEEIRAAGKGMILVTHDPGEAMALADRIAVMISGEIKQQDEPANLYARPQTTTIAALTGRVNVLNAGTWNAISRGEKLPESDDEAIGYRPEHLQLTASEDSSFIVRRKIFQGAFTDILVEGNSHSVYVRDGKDTYHIGQKVKLFRKKGGKILFHKSEK